MQIQTNNRSTTAPSTQNSVLSVWIRVGVAALAMLGLSARLSPLLDWKDRLPWQYLSEDGYLMQTIARNMALGLGMSTADGTIATNGVQPLATFLYAGLHWLAGGDKTLALVLITVFSTVVAAAAAAGLFKLVERLLAQQAHGRELALFTAASWFAAPLIVRHSMNGLETGLYHAAILLALNAYAALSLRQTPSTWSAGERLALGGLLGVTFLARNDAVFFIAALLAAHVLIGAPGEIGAARLRRIGDALVAGITSLLVASPWLIYNRVNFGSIVPISGAAQSHASTLGSNLPLLPANLFENTVIVLPLPGSIETWPWIMAFALTVVVLIVIGFWRAICRQSTFGRRLLLTALLFAVGLCGYYGVFFGAAWFIPRYLSPLSLFFWPATVVTAAVAIRALALPKAPPALMRGVAAATVIVLCGGFAWQQFRDGRQHMHRQVVEWVNANVAVRQWVGAPQTGTLGYFHDKTLNLDGKVNPHALAVLRTQGHVLDYVVDSKIDYIVDWVGMADWITFSFGPRFAKAFTVRVKDAQRNLAVLERIEPVTPSKP